MNRYKLILGIAKRMREAARMLDGLAGELVQDLERSLQEPVIVEVEFLPGGAAPPHDQHFVISDDA